jgi:hypothetical protein
MALSSIILVKATIIGLFPYLANRYLYNQKIERPGQNRHFLILMEDWDKGKRLESR